MSFVSYEFVFLFMPIFLIGWFCIKKHTGRKKLVSELYLIVMSIIFYGWKNAVMIAAFLPMIIFNWIGVFVMHKLDNKRKRLYLCILMLLVNIGIWLLVKCQEVFKINNESVYAYIVPIGISFYTIQQIMFLIDSYRDCNLQYGLIEYLAYSTFFPCIISGPIIKHDEFIPQLRKKCGETWENIDCLKIREGIISFSLGMGKKVIIARQIGIFADFGFGQPEAISSLVTIFAIFSYSFQLYFDFSGYCDMAEGIALIVGFSLPRNFESPYKAESINEFWKKWHITLTRFLTRYVYVIAGGGIYGFFRQAINIVIVYIVSGFWHGTKMTFMLWGLIHAILMIADKFKKQFVGTGKQHRAIGQCITFILVSLAWVPFRAESVADSLTMYKNIFKGTYFVDSSFWEGMCGNVFFVIKNIFNISSSLGLQKLATISFLLCLFFVVMKGKNVRELREQYANSNIMAMVCAIVLWLSIMQFEIAETFIYGGF